MKGCVAYLVRAGQDGPYSDTIYRYRIEAKDDMNEDEIIDYCTTHVHTVDRSRRVAKMECNGRCSWPYGMNSFYSFYREGDDYFYTVVYPYTD